MGSKDDFDPYHISKSSMKKLADDIDRYINEFFPKMVIPDDIYDELHDAMKEGSKRAEKLVKKLRKGKTSVFKDPEDWNSLF